MRQTAVRGKIRPINGHQQPTCPTLLLIDFRLIILRGDEIGVAVVGRVRFTMLASSWRVIRLILFRVLCPSEGYLISLDLYLKAVEKH